MIPLDTIVQGDCLEVMRGWPDGCVDAVVCDPPYGLSFMGKGWDTFGRQREYKQRDEDHARVEGLLPGYGRGGLNSSVVAYRKRANIEFYEFSLAWATEALRVLKPGGHLLAFGGTRTYHRMAVAIEDAGFEIRDMIDWLYGSGFPKSLDVGKAIDKAAGAEREVVGVGSTDCEYLRRGEPCPGHGDAGKSQSGPTIHVPITAPATPAAKQWDGWGTALKPGHEPICVARRPFPGTVADNVLLHGTGGLNIEAGRVGTEERTYRGSGAQPHKLNAHGKGDTGIGYMDGSGKDLEFSAAGRWPANVVLDPEAAAELDEQSGELVSKWGLQGKHGADSMFFGKNSADILRASEAFIGDSGGASRFFYCAKASRSERNAGAWHLYWRKDASRPSGVARCTAEEWRELGREERRIFQETKVRVSLRARGNIHATVKPVSLMRWLIRLVTPPGGVVLDPFAGSGTTCVAAKMEGFHYIGIELDPDYCEIARARVANTEKNLFEGT